MKKKEALEYLEKMKNRKGYITHSILLSIYNEEENIPDNFVKNVVVHKLEKPKPLTIYTGTNNIEAFNKALKG